VVNTQLPRHLSAHGDRVPGRPSAHGDRVPMVTECPVTQINSNQTEGWPQAIAAVWWSLKRKFGLKRDLQIGLG
jgi:hypothetical protein